MIFSTTIGRLLLGFGFVFQASAKPMQVGASYKDSGANPFLMAKTDFSIHHGHDAPMREWDEFIWHIPKGAFVAYSTDRGTLDRFLEETYRSWKTGKDHIGSVRDVTVLSWKNADNQGDGWLWGPRGLQVYYGAGLQWVEGVEKPVN